MKIVRDSLLKALHRERYSWFMAVGAALLIVALVLAHRG